MTPDQRAVLAAIKTICEDRAMPATTARAFVPLLYSLAAMAGIERQATPLIEKFASTIGSNGYIFDPRAES